MEKLGERAEMAVVLDAGGLIAIDRRDRRVGAMLRVAQRERLRVRTSACVVAQVWRDGARQANLARALTGVDVVAVDSASARRIGELLSRSRTADVVDAHLALIAGAADTIVTNDESDIRRLLDARDVHASLVIV